MELTASFYIGVSHYLDDSFSGAVGADSLTENHVNGIIGAVERGEGSVTIQGPGFSAMDASLSVDYVDQTDEPGVPVLVYVDATVDLADDLGYFEDFDDEEDDLLDDVIAILKVGDHELRASIIECEAID